MYKTYPNHLGYFNQWIFNLIPGDNFTYVAGVSWIFPGDGVRVRSNGIRLDHLSMWIFLMRTVEYI